jgi:ABC-type transporter Mla maintaining outer membrane lipid asymmetry permease subunit MlaE
MNPVWIAFTVGLIIGTAFGVVLLAILVAGRSGGQH